MQGRKAKFFLRIALVAAVAVFCFARRVEAWSASAAPSAPSAAMMFSPDPVFVSPDVDSHQGYTTDGIFHYTVHTNRIDKRNNDGAWSIAAQNRFPFAGIGGSVNHLGAPDYHDGKLYLPVERWNGCGNSTGESVAIYDAATLVLLWFVDISAIASEISSVAVVPEQNALYVASFCDGTKLWRFDLETLAFQGELRISQAIRQIQGITWDGEKFYVSSDEGGRLFAIYPDGTVVGAVLTYPINPGNEEGIKWHQGTLRWLFDNGVDQRVFFFAPLGAVAPPALNSGGVVNGASFSPGAELAPGSIASVFGTRLVSPFSSSDVMVSVNGLAAPIYAATPTQINFQVPWELSGASVAVLSVTVGGATSNPVGFELGTVGPGIFSTDYSGHGQGTVLIANTRIIAAPAGAFADSRPAQRGEYISIYCTGLGPVSVQPQTGAVAPASSLSTTIWAPQIQIGGVPAPVTFSGLAPGFVGLYQVDVQVPESAPTGPAVPVVLSIAGTVSNTVTIAVQ